MRSSLKINEKNHLEIGGCDTVDLVQKYGTPLYVLDESYIRHMCKTYFNALKENYDDFLVLYASKVFSCKAIYNIVGQENLGVDVVSMGELLTANSVNFPMNKVYMHGNNKTRAEVEKALELSVNTIVLDGFDEIEFVNSICKEKNKVQKVMLRINPGIEAHTHEYIQTTRPDSKFGLSIATGLAFDGVKQIIGCDNLDFCGFHCHIGSQITEAEPFKLACEAIIEFSAQVKDKLGVDVKELNLGGGFGIWYCEHDKEMTDDDYRNFIISIVEVINKAVENKVISKPKLIFEPGRSIVGEAGITLYTVGNQKHIEGLRDYVAVDGGMFENPRYCLYKADYTAVLANHMDKENEKAFTIAGKCCESGDLLIVDAYLPSMRRGDILAVLSTGAYNYSMASNYNRNLVPPSVIVKDGKSDYIVKPQTYDQLMQNDNIPNL